MKSARHFGFGRCVYVLVVAALLVSPLTNAAEVKEDPLDRQVMDIAKDLRCAVCQNQAISDSNADLARDMRAIIREQLQAGKSRQEIVDYFVARYGDYVLMKPPYQRAGTPLWIMPLVVLIVLGITGFVFLKHRQRDRLPPAPALSPEDLARVRTAREQSEKEGGK
jgi:cytochrome c-type biogenesis protein CcmH